MDAIASACEDQHIDGKIVRVIANVGGAPVLDRARARGLDTALIPHRNYPSREQFDQAILENLAQAQADMVILAGFMRILTPHFIRQYCGSLLNVHPSLLPKYPGLNTHERALAAGDQHTGTTVHFVTPVLDAGPIIGQTAVRIEAGDTPESLQARVQQEEHRLYPKAIQLCVEGRVALRDGELWSESGLELPVS